MSRPLLYLVVFPLLTIAVSVGAYRVGALIMSEPGPGGATTTQVAQAPEQPAADVAPAAPLEAPRRARTTQARAEPEPAAEPERLVVRRVSRVPEAPEPFDPVWFDAPGFDVELLPQTIAQPTLERPTVERVRVRSVTDGDRIAWLLQWDAPNPSTVSDTGRFSDAAALQFPLAPDATYMMGGPDAPVHVVYWRAQWQRDIDEGFQDVYAMYPNAWSDLYWFSEGEHPFHVADSFEDERSQEWFVAKSAGNPMADFRRERPVEELTAEGFGTLTYAPAGKSDARGVWRDGRWYVAIVRPIGTGTPADEIGSGATGQIAVAVWDGDAANVGARKHYSVWVEYEVDR